jgi:hypothetical protein
LGAAQRGGENWIEFDQVGSGFSFAFRIESTTGSRLQAEPSARIGPSDNDCPVSSPGFLAAISSSNQHQPARSVQPHFGFANPADRVSPAKESKGGASLQAGSIRSVGMGESIRPTEPDFPLRREGTIQNKTMSQYWHSGRGDSAQPAFVGRFGTGVPEAVQMLLRAFQRSIGKNVLFNTRYESSTSPDKARPRSVSVF